MELQRSQFDFLRQYIHRLCGLVITDEKMYLVTQRLDPLLERNRIASYAELCTKLGQGTDDRLNKEIIIAMTTNETFFFRDVHPFDTFLGSTLPELERRIVERKARVPTRSGPKVRIWCAASSTGQEPYSLAMLITEYVRSRIGSPLQLEDFEILATDISAEVLAKAMLGEYSDFEINRGLSTARRDRYFRKERDIWKIEPAVQRLITFRQMNLMESFSWMGNFDVIFCRNVLIYFDNAAKSRICTQLIQMLTDSGYLFLGASENMLFLDTGSLCFKTVHTGNTIYYQKTAPGGC